MTQKSLFPKNVERLVLAVLLMLCIPFLQSCTEELFGGGDEPDYVPDTEAPSIYIMSPTSEDMFVTTDNSLVISGTAHDNKALKEISYTTSAGAHGIATGLTEWSINDLQLAQGDNLIQVTAADEDDNKSSASITITRNKYLTFLGALNFDNDVLYTNEPRELWITISIAPNDHLIPSSVRLIEVDANNQVVEEVCAMYDDGNLDNGDEIKGDNVFSAKHVFNYSTEGTKKFRVLAKTQEAEGEVEGLSATVSLTVLNQQNAMQQVKSMLDIHEQIEQLMSENSTASAQEQESIIISWLQKQPIVKNAVSDNGTITISYVSGLKSFVMIDDNGETKGGYVTGRRNATPGVPLSQQTRGLLSTAPRRAAQSYAAPSVNAENYIQNKNVLIWAAFEDKFSIDMAPTLNTIFSNSPVSLEIKHLQNEQCTRASLLNLNNYGIIVFDTHGCDGDVILTREEAPAYSQLSQDDVQSLVSGINYISTIDAVTYYAVSSKFFRNKLNGTMPNSVIFNGSCESMKTKNLAEAFITKGAKTYLGFKESVSTSVCRNKADEFFGNLVGNDLKTTGESYIADLNFTDQDSEGTWINSYLMTGSKDMRFYMGLINGDFEYGNLNGWNTSGDGRVITQLGTQRPTQNSYMGIVSTGLGYTEKYGCISQSFKVTQESTLSINWNFLSEEFLEYVGSQYQDYLKITISDGSTSTQLFSMAIDGFASNYSLTRVSPEIIFDRGDVYMTGWQTSTFDISSYKGKTVTLTIETGDIGDSIYDSVTLLDEICIY